MSDRRVRIETVAKFLWLSRGEETFKLDWEELTPATRRRLIAKAEIIHDLACVTADERISDLLRFNNEFEERARVAERNLAAETDRADGNSLSCAGFANALRLISDMSTADSPIGRCARNALSMPWAYADPRDDTAQTGSLAVGQQIVANYEKDLIAEPRELAAAIDRALALRAPEAAGKPVLRSREPRPFVIEDEAGRAPEAADAGVVARGGLMPDWHAESVKLYRVNKALRKALQEQHDWHLAQGDQDFGNGIILNMSAEYSDSAMCERTTAVLNEVLPSGIEGYEKWKAQQTGGASPAADAGIAAPVAEAWQWRTRPEDSWIFSATRLSPNDIGRTSPTFEEYALGRFAATPAVSAEG